MTRARLFPLLGILALLTFTLPACDSGEDEDTPVGSYAATLFEVDLGVGPVNVLASGGQLQIDLRTNGTAGGRITIPAELSESEETEIDFEGTYTATGDQITFTHEADTFVRDATWTYSDGRLETQSSEITAVLVRQDLD